LHPHQHQRCRSRGRRFSQALSEESVGQSDSERQAALLTAEVLCSRQGKATFASSRELKALAEQHPLKAVRLIDVARRAGVSTASVSRVLNTPEKVSRELREQVEAALKELRYVPHGAARALASQRSRTIGAVVPTLGISIFAAGVEALQTRLHEVGYTLLIASAEYDLAKELELTRSLI
jgi:hypothetical protein